MTKVVVLGLDGCAWKLLLPLMKAGVLPNLKSVAENGASATLVSTIPPITSPAWPSMTTGLNPGKLGAYSTITTRRNDNKTAIRPVNSYLYKGRAIWDYLSDQGFKVALFRVPFLYPVYKINGCMVSGFGSSGKFFAYPSYVYDKLAAGPSRLLEERIFKQIKDLKVEDERVCVEFINQLTELVSKQSEIVLELSETFNWDFLFYVISAADWLQHAFMDRLVRLTQEIKCGNTQKTKLVDKALMDFYKEVDMFVGYFLHSVENAEDYVFFLVSDHGFTMRPRTFNVAKWLIREGYMKLKPECGKRSVFLDEIFSLIERIGSQALIERFLRVVPTYILSTMANRYYKARVSRVGSISKLIDFNASEAFCLEDHAIYINPSSNYEKIQKMLIEKLKRYVESLDGPKLRVFTKNEVYWGDKVDLGPDLIIQITEGSNIWELSTDPKRPMIFRPSLPGIHERAGIFLAYGPQVKKGVWLKNMLIWDIASILLHVFDVPIPTHIDGKVQKEIYQPGSDLTLRPVKYQHNEKERIRKTVKKLKPK